tara:strand:- start:108 stop:1055 length:948 start_codon:yes stop_codon:yes gene_type:complete
MYTIQDIILALYMELLRKNIISDFPWLKEKNKYFIISADYDGLICASFLNHYLNWTLAGYYNMETLWLTEDAIKYKSDIIWVDLNILPIKGRTIGGHIVSIDGVTPKGFKTSCNPNLLLNINSNQFEKKFPFSTILFLMWIHNVYPENKLKSKLLLLHADAVWLKFQNYPDNVNKWKKILTNYQWNKIFSRVNSKNFDKHIDQILYSQMKEIGALSNRSKLSSKHLNIKSREYLCNPDWDDDIILKLFNIFGNELNWSPPQLPLITKKIKGVRNKTTLSDVKKIGLNNFIKSKKIFSYAVPSSRTFNYTSFYKKY